MENGGQRGRRFDERKAGKGVSKEEKKVGEEGDGDRKKK